MYGYNSEFTETEEDIQMRNIHIKMTMPAELTQIIDTNMVRQIFSGSRGVQISVEI